MKARIALLSLILASLACMTQVETPTPAPMATVTNTPRIENTRTPVPSPTPTMDAVRKNVAIVRQATVNVHGTPGGNVIGWVSGGDTVTVVSCEGDWCKIEDPAGYVWRGCLSGNEDLGCQAK